MLYISLEDWIPKEELEIIQWTPEYGSVVTEMAQLQMCNLNSMSIIQHILDPFGLLKSNDSD